MEKTGRHLECLLLLLCMLVLHASAITCPDVVERRIAPGDTCTSDVGYYVNGKHSSQFRNWADDIDLKPGIDCFPESTHGYTHTRGDEECDVTVRVLGVCSWNPNHCWPGDCDDNLATNCQCRAGFYRTGGSSTGRRCKWSTRPDLNTCRVAAIDSQGENTNSTNTGSRTDCSSQRDEGIKTQPTHLYFVIKADFTMSMGSLVPYVSESQVGIVGAKITAVKVSLDGSESTIVERSLVGPPYCQERVSATNPLLGGALHDCEASLSLPTHRVNLKDGDSVCADMEASAGGYYKLQDNSGNYKGTETFPETHKSKRVCFIYDETKPAHCTETGGTCSSEPLTLSTRLTRQPQVEVHVDGWTDPKPPGGERNPKSASGIDRFRLEVHGVDVGMTTLTVQDNAIAGLTKVWNASVYSWRTGGPYDVTVTLPEEQDARMYALILEVHDKAGNVGYARRLLLLDNSSSVELMPSSSLHVVHANPNSNHRWQTDVSKEVCVAWAGRFYNTDMRNNNFLMKVSADNGREIHGRYDQASGVLPVSGTDNVVGVTRFEMSWSRDQAPRSVFTEVSDVFAQTICLHQPLHDGETYDVWIRATDVMSNNKEDSVRVSIDHSGPEVTVEGLRGRWDRDGLYVHNSTDLSTMRLVLSAADPHSGLITLHWALSTHPLAADVGEGAVGVQRLDNGTSCTGRDYCYCPSVGDCEIHRYVVTFTNLVHHNTHQGDHHREYYVTITATNAASLTTTTTVDILLDESPPSVGVVWEGLSDGGQAEMDFTSNDVVHVRWYGYQDHESGIALYRVLLASRCMTGPEVGEAENATEVEQGNMASFKFPSEGLYYVSVVAYNGALEPSEVACSDGITYDTTPPALLNVSITHARGGQTVGCTQPSQAWLVHTNLTRVAMSNVTECHAICSSGSSVRDVRHLPVSSLHVLDPELSRHYCRKLPKMTEDSFIVLPSDYVRITWQGEDAESDMEEYYIGMGGDRTTSSAPDLLPFTRTHGHPSYHALHAGLGHGDLFFVFLRAVNKAGLSVALTLGPVLIDVTAPDVTQPLTVAVEGEYLVVTWQEGVFVDSEQPDDVDLEVTFRVGYTGGFVTPFLTLPESSLAQCRKDNITGCARYPIKALYAHDTEDGRSFFFQLHVTNAAGHVTTVNTSSTRLPAHYPPSHAVVMDVLRTAVTDDAAVTATSPVTTPATSGESPPDLTTEESSSTSSPAMSSSASPALGSTETVAAVSLAAQFSEDVDVVIQREELCVAWSGFYHQEEVSIEVGVGTVPDLDDVIDFQPVKNESHVCLNVTSVPVYTKLFSVAKATSSGGTAVFSSDGFVLIPKADAENHIKVFNGKGCHDSNVVGSRMIDQSTTSLDLSDTASIPIHPGDFLFVQLSPFLPGMTFHNAILLQTTLTGYQLIAMKANVTAALPVSMPANNTARILHCQKDSTIVPASQNHVTVTWEISGPWKQFVKYLKVEIMDKTCLETAAKKDKYSHQQCLLHEEEAKAMTEDVHVHTNNVFNDHTYVSSISPCFDDGCLPPVLSDAVTYTNTRALTPEFDRATIQATSSQELQVDLEGFVESWAADGQRHLTPACVYQWAVSRDRSGSIPVTDWTVRQSPSCSDIQIHEQVAYSGDGKGTLYACLKLLFPWTSDRPRCVQLTRPLSSSAFDPFHVVELDHRTFRQTDFEPFLHTQQLGTKLHQLYDLDLDFATSDVMLSAILTNSEGRNVTWSLMTNRRAPNAGDCAGDADCVTSATTATGHVTFPRHLSKLQNGHVYFVCAVTSAESSGEAAVGLQTVLKVCGDGVVVDDSPPVKGSVAVGNADGGFLADRGHVLVTWSGFSDVEMEVSSLPDDVTFNYSVALGSYPGGEDLARYVPVGQRTTWTFAHLSMASGLTCFATVRAQDRVGHVTEAWSELVVIDKTPPIVGRLAAGTITAETFVPGHELPVHWEGVEDRESGIKSIEVGVTQEGGGDNVIEFQTCAGTPVTLTDTSSLVDGHSYVLLLKVTNGAGLTTLKSSSPFVIDSSPPSPGHVWHSGFNTTSPSGYSREVGVVRGRWAGFTDPHSGLDYFRAGLGSSPGLTDVVPFVYMGRRTTYTWKRELDQGTKYYVTLQACNRAGLCRVTSSSSVTFDDSPPTSGHVTVGFDGHHTKFLGHNSSVPVQWTGFSDPQSGIQHFTWCVGRTPGLCDVSPSTHTLLSRAAHSTRLALPVATPLYVTVRARNPAGLETASVSDSFVVDPTPPEVVSKPHFLSPRDGSPAVSQWDRSVLRMTWDFRDPESSVVSHTVYVRSKLTGRLVVDPVILGADTELTLTLDKSSLLTDGDSHWVAVSACNAAHLCIIATSDVIAIDSTPPVTGTFLSPLLWSRQNSSARADVMTTVEVRWRAFSDAESGVTRYELMAGREYNGEELSGGRVEVRHDDNATGAQQHRLQVNGVLHAGDVIHLSLLAINALGLPSPVVRMAFRCLLHDANGTSGSLVLIRHSCEASYCTKECTCAAAGQVCKTNTSACVELSASDPALASFQVLPYMGTQHGPQSLNPAAASTQGVIPSTSTQSYIPSTSTQGVIPSTEAHSSIPSTSTQSYISSTSTQGLIPSTGTQSYIPSTGTDSHVPSPSPRLFTTSAKCLEGHWALVSPPSLVNVSRFEFSFSLANMSAGEGVFESGTEPVWYDVGHQMSAAHCMPGNRTLMSGKSYILHVRVWMSPDSHVTFTSPPVDVDHSPPQVKRGKSVIESDVTCALDIDYVTTERSYVTACWDGVFVDTQSHVTKYQVWIGTSPHASNHLDLTDVDLNTTWTLPTMHLEPGTRYYVTVRAWNEAGLKTTAVSDGFVVDVTPPLPGVVFASGRHSNRHAQSSTSTVSASWHGFEDRHSGVMSYHVAVYDAADASVPLMPFTDVGVKTGVRLQNLNLQHQHRYQVAVKARDAAGLESQVVLSPAILVDVTPPEGVTCTDFRLQEETALSLQPATSVLHDTYVADIMTNVTDSWDIMRVEVTAVGVDESADGFLHVAELKMPLHFRFSPSGVATAQHSFLSPYSGDLRVQLVVESQPGAAITAKLYRCSRTVPSPGQSLTLTQVSLTSVSVCARIRDRESGIKSMMVGVGTTDGGLQVRPWTAVGHSGHVIVDVHVQHATPIYATAVSENQAGEWSRFASQPITFDRTGPHVSEVTLTLRYEGDGQANGTEVWAEASWTAEDRESGVELCTCRLEGQATNQSAEQQLGHVTEGECQWQLLGAQHGSEVRVHVTCVNTVQLHTTTTSLPVTVLLRPPDVTQITMETISNNALMSPYDRSSPQVRSSNSSLQFFWRGVQDPSVTRFYFRFLLESGPLTEWSPLDVYKTAAMLERGKGGSGRGVITGQLKAVNDRMMTSEVVSATALLDDSKPLLTGRDATASLVREELQVDWRHVFDVTRDVTFSLFAGTEEGYGDVINHVTTKSTHYRGHWWKSLSTIYVSVQAVYDNGLTSTYTTFLDL